jgi:hypothetical protein
MIAELIKDLADPQLSDRLREHAAALTKAAQEHHAAKSALDLTGVSLANQRNDLERLATALQAKEVALKKRESEVEIAEQRAHEDRAALAAQQAALTEKGLAIETRIKQAAASESRLAHVKAEAAELMQKLGGLR